MKQSAESESEVGMSLYLSTAFQADLRAGILNWVVFLGLELTGSPIDFL